jgi:hypothetical protein
MIADNRVSRTLQILHSLWGNRQGSNECEDSLLNFEDFFSEEGYGEPLSFKPPCDQRLRKDELHHRAGLGGAWHGMRAEVYA